MTAFELQLGERKEIAQLNNAELELKLLEMGCYPGNSIEMVYRSVWNDPVCIRVSDYLLLLRKEEALSIQLKEAE